MINSVKKALELDNVCVDIPLYKALNLKLSLLNPKGFRANYHRALSNINLSLTEGSRTALIGHNGAGKSTLLRLASGIISHTSGILKKNTKFEPLIDRSFLVDDELDARAASEAYFVLKTGSLRGFENYLKDILKFANLEKFEDYPIKTYSEGMRTRLQFALLTSFPAEALALDETLGAGDAAFIEKAQIRFRNFLESSATLLFASHSEDLLKEFCDDGIVLNSGRIVFKGPIKESLEYYQASRGGNWNNEKGFKTINLSISIK